MMTYNFKARFVPLIESGSKLTTIRAPRKDGKLPKPGEALRLYTGMRTKACRKIGRDRTCRSVKPIAIWQNAPVIAEGAHEIFLSETQREELAKNDGFASWIELLHFFETVHTLPFHGFLIEWNPL